MTPDDTSPIRIRPARQDDYADVVELWRQCGLKIAEHGRDGEAPFRQQLERFSGLYLVAVDGERIVGVVLGTHDLRKGWINRLAVSPQCQRRGIASRLVRACDQALRRSGIEIVAALVEPHNRASLRLFERLEYPTDVPVIYFRKASPPGA